MKHLSSSLAALAFAAAASQAPAQDASAPKPAADAAPAAALQVSDAEIDQFAQATVKVQAINADASLAADAKQTQMAAAVKAAGLDPVRYNEIAKALPNDSALLAKVKTAMAKYMTPAPTPTPAKKS